MGAGGQGRAAPLAPWSWTPGRKGPRASVWLLVWEEKTPEPPAGVERLLSGGPDRRTEEPGENSAGQEARAAGRAGAGAGAQTVDGPWEVASGWSPGVFAP